jgi:hypothetical protein
LCVREEQNVAQFCSARAAPHVCNARIPAMPKTSARLRAKKIKLLLFDVDGVLTDGKIYIFPAPAGIQQSTQDHAAKHGGQGGFGLVSQSLIEAKGFHAHDGNARVWIGNRGSERPR